MVELNQTLFPLLGPIGTVVNTVKVLIGGVFGLYLIILYFRVREYLLLRKMFSVLQKELRMIGDKIGVDLGPRTGLPTIIAYIKEKLRQKPTEPTTQPAYKPRHAKAKKHG
ncbi:hypothetical protein KY363_01980 [Candidatus Woesearchaeota archaeon]|nr:hypothetical protein [Candidatus Woesearchaeota archaeon]